MSYSELMKNMQFVQNWMKEDETIWVKENGKKKISWKYSIFNSKPANISGQYLQYLTFPDMQNLDTAVSGFRSVDEDFDYFVH